MIPGKPLLFFFAVFFFFKINNDVFAAGLLHLEKIRVVVHYSNAKYFFIKQH